MCVVCGCGDTEERVVDGRESSPAPDAAGSAAPTLDPSTGDLHYGAGTARVSVPGMSQARAIEIETDVLGENARHAASNRAHFRAHGVTAYDLVSSPGSGKTTLLCRTIGRLAERRPSLPVAVIEGDQQTRLDADRVRATGAGVVQVNTGKGCHLDAAMVGAAFERLGLHAAAHGGDRSDGHAHDHGHAHEHGHGPGHEPRRRASGAGPEALLLIENVGNLVCPAMWDLGEAAKVVILSVTEGADKPLKYPDMFAAADLLVLNKIDLLPYVDFDLERCLDAARRINPGIDAVSLSATTGEGVDDWIDWLLRAAPAPGAVRAHDLAP